MTFPIDPVDPKDREDVLKGGMKDIFLVAAKQGYTHVLEIMVLESAHDNSPYAYHYVPIKGDNPNNFPSQMKEGVENKLHGKESALFCQCYSIKEFCGPVKKPNLRLVVSNTHIQRNPQP